MSTIKFDPEPNSIDIIDEIVQTIRDKVKAWADGDDKRFAEFRDNNIEECTDFVLDVENGLNERLKTVFLCEIGNEFERQTDGGVFQSDPFNESFLKRACIN